MYKDLADATESLKEKGYEHIFELSEDNITCKELETTYSPEELTIDSSHRFDAGTDPGSESTIYAIVSDSGVKGILITSYGMYVNKKKAALIDHLLKTE